MSKPRERYIKRLIERSEKEGITSAKFMYTAQVILAGASRLRCQYDCLAKEKTIFHPPHTPEIEISRELLLEYRFGLLIRTEIPSDPMPTHEDWDKFTDNILRIEKTAFLEGYTRALVLCIGTCQYLHRDDSFRACTYNGKRRPTFEAVGVELLNTLEFVAWHSYAHREEGEPFQQFALLMLE